MNSVLIYVSTHHGNTKKIAQEIATGLNAELVNLSDTAIPDLADYDLIGFGSGIYWGKHDRKLLDLVSGLPRVNGKKAFIFSTSGLKAGRVFNRRLRRNLLERGFDIIGAFSCKGFDNIWPLKLIGGMNKGRPNERDLEAAASFAKGLKVKCKALPTKS
ncbi:MAG TPA: flavodoxin family protein [Desulfobacteria bacterium]|nr:flavodoxin family protein [Desulfobacteria bacterium]